MQLPAPFGKYELLELIGTGGMADVFLARTFGVAGFEKRLVIKRIKEEHAGNPRFVSLFIHEAKIGVHLNHPNIVALYELGKVGESWYIAMEHLHGRDLNKVARALRTSDRRMDPSDAVRIIAEICRGLAFAHSGGGEAGVSLVHRDVSPHNIFVTFTGEVKLVDFGIARLLGGGDARQQDEVPDPAVGPGGGKYAYMSPEQAAGLPVGPRSDLFSAAVVLWELLVGQKLHGGAEREDKLRRVREAEIADPRTRGADIDDALWATLKKALARDPADRHESASMFEDELRAWLYERRARPGRTALGALLQELFPDSSDHNPAAGDLKRLVDDIRRMEHEHEATVSTSGAQDVPKPDAAGGLQAAVDERKRVAVLALDVDGFTAISVQEEPEVLFRRHLQLLRWLRTLLDEHGGTIQHIHDDHIVVIFGLPRTLSDDLHRALDAAWALQKRLGEVRERGLPISIAVGVHIGDVTVAHAGTRTRLTARGDTTRLARRLSDHADHGMVLVSEAVYQAVEGAFGFQRGPWMASRGGRAPVASWVLGGRRAGARAARTGPWLRRGDELETVRSALGKVASGQGAAVLIVGKGGSGKSRLVQELTELAIRRHIPVYHGACVSYGSPHSAPRAVLLGTLGLPASASEAEVRAHAGRFRQLGLSPLDLDSVEALLGLRPPPEERLEPWTVTRRALRALSAEGPLVAVFEDVHHLPPRELAAFGAMIERLAGTPILVLATCAGEVPAAIQRASVVHLGALGKTVEAKMVAGLVGAEGCTSQLLELVERTCEGNPLYVEEMAKFLVERGDLTVSNGMASLREGADAALPGTLAGLLAARVDALDPAAKGALQIAAVIGADFVAALVGEVIGVDEPMPIVDVLVTHGLIHPTDAPDTFAFSSQLVRQAVLRGILGIQRGEYHRLIADALERRRVAGVDVPPDVLAAHCGFGGRWIDAARWSHTAGRAHEGSGALESAREAYRRGLRWLGEVEETPDTYDARVQGESTLRLRLGVVSLLLGDNAAGLSALRVALDIAEEAGLGWIEVQAHLELGRHHLDEREVVRARAHLAQAHALARQEREPAVEVEVLEARARLAHLDGATAEAESLWRDALARGAADPSLRARCLAGLAHARLQTGDLEAPRPWLDEALEAARQAGDSILEGRVLNNLGLLHALRDEPEEAARLFRRSLEARERVGYAHGVVVNHYNLGTVYFQTGDLARAYVSFQRGREVAEELGWPRGVALNEVYLAYIDGTRGGADGLERVQAASSIARKHGDVETALNGGWLAGRLLMAMGRDPDAREELEAARDEAAVRGMIVMVRRIERTLESFSVRPEGDASQAP